MEMKIPAIAITAVVVIVVLAGVLMPVLDDATATEDTFTNDGIVRMTKYDTTAEITAFWDHTAPNQITVNGTVVALPRFVTSGTEISVTASGTTGFMLRYVSATANNQTISFIDASGSVTAGVNTSSDATITVSGGTMTFSNGTTTKTGTYTDYLFFVSNDGDYVMKAPNDTSYLNGDSEIYGIGRTKVGTTNYSMVITGNIDDGWDASIVQTNTITLSDVTGDYEESSKYLDLYEFTGVNFTATLSDVDYPVTYNQVIVPYEVSAERAEHFTDNQNAIFAAIPIMVIVALLIAVVALVFRGRDF